MSTLRKKLNEKRMEEKTRRYNQIMRRVRGFIPEIRKKPYVNRLKAWFCQHDPIMIAERNGWSPYDINDHLNIDSANYEFAIRICVDCGRVQRGNYDPGCPYDAPSSTRWISVGYGDPNSAKYEVLATKRPID